MQTRGSDVGRSRGQEFHFPLPPSPCKSALPYHPPGSVGTIGDLSPSASGGLYAGLPAPATPGHPTVAASSPAASTPGPLPADSPVAETADVFEDTLDPAAEAAYTAFVHQVASLWWLNSSPVCDNIMFYGQRPSFIVRASTLFPGSRFLPSE